MGHRAGDDMSAGDVGRIIDIASYMEVAWGGMRSF